MTAHAAQFEGTAGGMVLTNAILLYRTQAPARASAYAAPGSDGQAFASIHAIEHDDDLAPTIATGTPLTRAHLRQWTKALGRAAPPEILPHNVLVAHEDVLAWWVPAQVRSAFFDLTRRPATLRALGQKTIMPVPYPAHLLVATRTKFLVCALRDNERPTAATQLLHSPILNVFVDGSLCWGNIPRPRTLSVSTIPEFERALFDSWSTHPNQGQELTVTGKGGLVKLWDDLAARRARRFPVYRLKPFFRNGTQRGGAAQPVPMTFGHLISGGPGR